MIAAASESLMLPRLAHVVRNYLGRWSSLDEPEDERIRFYLEHGARIREWARLENEVRNFVDQFYRSLNGDPAPR